MIPTRTTTKIKDKTPRKDGNYSVRIDLILTPELFSFLREQADKEKRSPTNIIVRALELYKIKSERLGV